MKLNNIWFIVLGLLVISSFEACKGKQKKQASEGSYYTCPMHPEIHKSEAGDCPICGMFLVEKKEAQKDTLHIEVSDLVKPTYENILSQMELIKPVKKEMEVSVEANGIIEYDTRRFENISSRFSGRIEKLYVKYLYQPVQKGQKLFDVYSPELITEQQNLLFLLANDVKETNLIEAAKQKLSLLGMSEVQINDVVKSRKAMTIFSVYSSFDGYTISSEAKKAIEPATKNSAMGSAENPQSSNQLTKIREGSYIEKGQTLFRLANNKVVWAVLKIYENDISNIKLNQKTEIYTDNSKQPIYTGILNFIESFHNTDEKALNVRIYIPNDDNKLKIGQLVTGKMFSGNKPGLWIPKTSVLDLGEAKIVFVKNKALFQAKAIETGIEVENMIQIISGINEKTEIATNAQYLTDSESFIKVKQ